MNCPKCERPMVALFLSYACDWCDGLTSSNAEHTGYVVHRRALPSLEYVFPSEEDAQIWRSARQLEDAPIRRVRSFEPFRWRPSTGAIQNMTTADRLYEIHEDDRYPPTDDRAHLDAARCAAP